MSTKQKVVKVPIGAIKQTIFVRTKLNHERVTFFESLFTSEGADIKPIELTDDTYELLDGRHRLSALTNLGATEVECVLLHIPDHTDQVLYAMKANSGGALPPAEEDFVFTFRGMLEQGITRKKILDGMEGVIPRPLARRYLDNAQSNIANAALTQAMQAVLDGGKTLQEAADTFAVEIETLRKKLAGAKGKKKKGLAQSKSHVTTIYRSHSKKLSAVFAQILKDHQDGEPTATTANVDELFNHIEKLSMNVLKNVAQWRKRYEAQSRKEKK